MTVLKEEACKVHNNNSLAISIRIIKVDSSLIRSDKKGLRKEQSHHTHTVADEYEQ